MRRGRKVILIVGLSCSGKTTLAAGLADALGAGHLCIGDLIREARARSAECARITEEAFRGTTEFSVEWLTPLVGQALADIEAPLVVIDGGIPMDRVLERLALDITAILVLALPEAERKRRFEQRRLHSSAASRDDDLSDLFERRSRFQRDRLSGFLASFAPSVPQLVVAAGAAERWSLRQALSLLTFADARAAIEATAERVVSGRYPAAFAAMMARGDAGAFLRWEEERPKRAQPSDAWLVHFKPRLEFPVSVYERVEEHVVAAGFAVTAAVAYCGAARERRALARAHFDSHYLMARWGPRLIRGPGAEPYIAAYDALQASVGPNRKVGQNLWAAFDPATEHFVLNSHIPSLLDDYAGAREPLAAVLIEATTRAHASFRAVRGRLIGATEPLEAIPGSLRHLAASGALGIVGRISLRNNAFHSPAGPIEAIRETALWFGHETALRIAAEFGASPAEIVELARCDRPLGAIGCEDDSLYAASMNVDHADVRWPELVEKMRVSA